MWTSPSKVQRPLASQSGLTSSRRSAVATGRPVDLIDPGDQNEPLLARLFDTAEGFWAAMTPMHRLISRHLSKRPTFMPYRRRILAEAHGMD